MPTKISLESGTEHSPPPLIFRPAKRALCQMSSVWLPANILGRRKYPVQRTPISSGWCGSLFCDLFTWGGWRRGSVFLAATHETRRHWLVWVRVPMGGAKTSSQYPLTSGHGTSRTYLHTPWPITLEAHYWQAKYFVEAHNLNPGSGRVELASMFQRAG